MLCFLLGSSPASELYMPTFRNTLSVPSSYHLPMKMEQIECSEKSAYIIQTQGNYSKENIIYVCNMCVFVICVFQLLLRSTFHVVRRDLVPLHKKVPLALYSNLSSLDNRMMAYTQGRNM